MRTKAKVISPKQLQFVEGILRGLTQKDAAVQAGFSARSAVDAGCRLMANEFVIKELAKYRDRTVAKIERTMETILAKNDEAQDFAKQTKNANALVKAIELEARVTGHVDNPNKSSGMNLIINIGNIHGEDVKEIVNNVIESASEKGL